MLLNIFTRLGLGMGRPAVSLEKYEVLSIYRSVL
jgi:hypothetical protein